MRCRLLSGPLLTFHGVYVGTTVAQFVLSIFTQPTRYLRPPRTMDLFKYFILVFSTI